MSEEEKIRSLKDAAEAWKGMSIALRDSDPVTSFLFFRWHEVTTEAAQEMEERVPVETEIEGGGSTWWYVCGDCHTAVDSADRFCRQCGRPLKWK